MPESKPPSFPSLVQRFFTEYLTAQRAVSLRTVACYRDGLTLFLSFAQRAFGQTSHSAGAGRSDSGADSGFLGLPGDQAA